MTEILEVLKLLKDPALILCVIFILILFKLNISRDEAQKQMVEQLSTKISQFSETNVGLATIIKLCCIGRIRGKSVEDDRSN